MGISINSVPITAMSSIMNLLTVERKPIMQKNLLITDIKNRIKQVGLSSRRDFLRTCLNKGLATGEIISLAKRVVRDS